MINEQYQEMWERLKYAIIQRTRFVPGMPDKSRHAQEIAVLMLKIEAETYRELGQQKQDESQELNDDPRQPSIAYYL